MNLFQAILYGIIQGLTEFLPVSSSAHLAILHWLQGNPHKELELSFDVALHVGTLIPVLVYFRHDWFRLIKGFFNGLLSGNFNSHPDSRMALYIIIATIPAVIIGILLKEQAEFLFRAPILIALMMGIMGTFLLWADRSKNKSLGIQNLSWKIIILIGIAQSLAIIPGVSRSGITITTGLFCRLNSETATRFSFLLSAPIIAGAAMIKLPELFNHGFDIPIIAGIITSGIIGWLAIAGLLRYVQKHSFLPFVIYRYGFALFVLIMFIMGGL